MPQETNLNVAPYFDDFDAKDTYCKILFKPGLPVQARELTGIQSILQNQIEKFGQHVFKDGASVTGGGVRYNGGYNSIRIQISNEGVDVNSYLDNLLDQVVVGSISGVKAKIKSYIGKPTGGNWYVLFLTYLNTGGEGNEVFSSGESLLLDNNVVTTRSGLVFQPGEPVAQLVTGACSFVGSAAVLTEGIYFLRGYFVEVKSQTLILDPYRSNVDFKVGLRIQESVVTSDLDENLTDNAAGYSNYTAPGADRLSISALLTAISPEETEPSNFIQLMEIRGGNLIYVRQENDYNELGNELAKRTFDESGNYYIRPFSLTTKNTLNDFEGNNGIFNSNQITYNNNTPSKDLGSYKLSPGKAYVEGFEVETVVPTFLDFEKPRTTKLLENQSINYVTGPTFTLNRVSGSPIIGIGTDYTVSLRDQRVGAAGTTAAGKEIGLARVYDFALESGSYNNSVPTENEWDIALYDIQTYTNITLNTNPTNALVVPTHIKGKSSGAVGYLRYNSVGTAITAYNTKGTFITGEQLIFNGVESGNISAASTSYTTSDIKSINGTVSTASTFNADVKQSLFANLGEVNISAATTSGASLGISTVTNTDPSKFFIGIATVGNIVEYSNPGKTTVSYARIESVSQNSLTISGVTTVAGVCEGGLPTIIAGDALSGEINPSNFKILTSQFQSSTDNNLYTHLPKKNVSTVDLTNSHITIKKQFDVTISGNSTGAISSGNANETFLSYDEENYTLIRTDGTTESLSADKFNFNTGSTQVTINGLGTDSPAKLIATLRKINVTSKIKEKQKINVLNIVGSASSTSGIGTTTLNDGLTYNTIFGTRVQDSEISLNVPDVTKVYGVYESSNANNASLPVLTLTSINSSTAKTGDLLIGEMFVGDTSKSTGVYVSKNTDSAIDYTLLNDFDLQVGEIVTFQESGITATVGALALGSNNITDEFTYDDGQRSTIYDYSRVVRKPGYDAPSKRLSIIFESAYFAASDTGDITTVNSYDNFDYDDLHVINDCRVNDLIDIRPRVSDFSGTARSPFEFLGRSFTASGNSAQNILASDRSILLDYSFYLPRCDKIYLSKSGKFQLIKGTPAETPEFPVPIDGALEVASIKLPAYLFNVNNASITLANYKRYQMSDINKLERRIENLEFYTSLTLLESDTLNMQITDTDGLNRFKSGFFVDDFSNTENQLKTTIVKNSIDYHNGELRPAPYTTELDLKLDLNSANGIRKTGRLLTLDYDDVVHANQPFATRVENITPYLVSYFGGTIDLVPDSDIWIDEVILEAKTEDLVTYTSSSQQLSASEFDSRTGYGPVSWGRWNDSWSGHTENWTDVTTDWVHDELIQTTTVNGQQTGTSSRTASKSLIRETFSTINEGPKVINTQISSNMRSRNIKFDARTLKPSTSLYAFFDGQDVAKFIIPKLLEISMTTGTFQVGETVIGTTANGKELIRFKVAQSNHKRGPFDAPIETYNFNPYYQFTPLYSGGNATTLGAVLVDSIVPSSSTTSSGAASADLTNIPELYSSTSTILNIDLESLAEKADNTYFGYVEKDLKLVGETSSAQATISNVKLRSDSVGSVIGSFFIPNPNIITNPKFESGKKVFRLTSSNVNSQNGNNVSTDVSKVFESSGSINTLQATIISVKNISTDVLTKVENKSISGPITTIDDVVTISSTPSGDGGTDTEVTWVDVVEELDTKEETAAFGANEDFIGKLSKTYNGVTQTSYNTGIIPITNDQNQVAAVQVNDPIGTAYAKFIANNAGTTQTTPSEGDVKYWTASIAKELGADASSTDIEARMTEHLVFANTAGAVEAFEADAANMAAVEANFAAIAAETGIEDKGGYAQLKKDCGWGVRDPLAQSFFVGGSIYVTKVDLYFGSKDQFLPCSVQLRTMSLGVPTTEIIPFGEVVLDPEDINISDDASVKTTVTFPSPVYLPGGKSYAIVLLSTSNEYTAWISRMGETDVRTKDRPEAEQIVVSQQPTLGSLFKSQNGETWNASQYEDLKFTLYRARFSERSGNINFTNPPLLTYSDDIPPLLKDSFEINSNKIRIGFNTTISDTAITVGNIVQQTGSNATGRYVGAAGTATGNLTITNPGVGYTPSSGSETYNHVPMVTQTGSGRNGTLNLTITNGVAIAATVVSGGSGYTIGDVVGVATVGLTSLGKDIKFSIASLTGTNEFVLDNVQGDFVVGATNTINYVTGAGVTVLNYNAGGNVRLSGSPVTVSDGLHIKVNQKNNGMYSTQNTVTFADVGSDVQPTVLSADYDSTSTGSISVDDGTDFAEFENVGVGSTNLGYVKIGSEILSYGGVSNNTLTGVTRGVDSTKTLSHSTLDQVNKYELNGVSLRRINTNHNLADATVSNPQGLDFFNIKVDMSTNGVDRSVGTSLPKLHFNQTKSAGGSQILSTENIPFEIVTPIVQNVTPTGTALSAQIRTVTSSSIDGSESPFQDKGFEDITLEGDNYMSTPRMVASRINETTSLTTLPDNKSFTMNLSFYGADATLSPVVDLDRIGVILTSNRINNPVTNYITDNRVKTLKDDPNAFVYASKPVTLKSGATGIKIHLEGHINLTSDLRAFYAISENPNDELIYQPFPGYDNLLTSGQIIDPSKNSGLPDSLTAKTDVIAYTSNQVIWNDYEFTIDDLPTFRYYSIKLVGTGTNQAQPPRVKNLRVIALA
jgi:hypothetical protein